jgi:hypothetical protein
MRCAHASRYPIARATTTAIVMADFDGPRNVFSWHAGCPDRLMATKTYIYYKQNA